MLYVQIQFHQILIRIFHPKGYLEALLEEKFTKENNPDFYVEIVTPKDPEQRGCQLSAKFSIPVVKLKPELDKRGVVVSELKLQIAATFTSRVKRPLFGRVAAIWGLLYVENRGRYRGLAVMGR